jgi:DNA-binding response OmpR family regulator
VTINISRRPAGRLIRGSISQVCARPRRFTFCTWCHSAPGGYGDCLTHKILIIDTDNESRHRLENLLGQPDHTVRGVRTFSDGLRALEAFDPDLLIAEVRLNEDNGISLFLQGRRRAPTMACILMSGYQDPVLEREALEQGVFAFLLKPFDSDVVLDRVAGALNSRGKRRWPRKAMSGFVASVEGQQARVLDISYGGMRLELPFEAFVGLPLEINIPEIDYTLRANTVWIQDVGAGTQICGAVLKMGDQSSAVWHELVDTH